LGQFDREFEFRDSQPRFSTSAQKGKTKLKTRYCTLVLFKKGGGKISEKISIAPFSNANSPHRAWQKFFMIVIDELRACVSPSLANILDSIFPV